MKRIATILLITVLISQTAAAAKKTSGDLLSFEYGVLTVYNLDAASPLGAGYLFGLGIVLTDSLEASFVHTKGDGTILKNYNLLRLNLYIKQKVGLSLTMGSAGTLTTGLGLFMDIFKKKRYSIATVFQLRLDYLITQTSNTTGSLLFGLSAKLGI